MNDNPSAQRIDWIDLAKGVAIILYVDMNFRRYGNALMFYAGGLSGTLLVMKLSMLTTDGKIFSLISSYGRQSMIILLWTAEKFGKLPVLKYFCA